MRTEPTLHSHVTTFPDGRQAVAEFRRASVRDIPDIEQLIARAWRALSQSDYTPEQIESALGAALGVDSQLVHDGTYFVAEVEGRLVACGGWSWRKTLFGSDGEAGRQPDPLDPARDPARIRAFFVDPDWARRGLGRAVLERCEREALAAGFTSASLMATLPGERLYRACGYMAGTAIEHELTAGVTIRFVPMYKCLTRGVAPMDVGVILRRFETPDDVREMTLGRFEVIRLGGLTIGRATYQPGWKWSTHVGPVVGAPRCTVEHLGMVVSGVATAAFADGRVIELRPGDVFYIPPEPHDSWVVGNEPYVSLHFMGADKYARKAE